MLLIVLCYLEISLLIVVEEDTGSHLSHFIYNVVYLTSVHSLGW